MTAPGPVYRIALIDDHPLLRVGVAALLEAAPEFELVGEAGNAAEARALIEQTDPDLALIDLKLSRDDGLVLVRELRWLRPRLRIVVLTMIDDETYRARAQAAGASAYVHKETAAAELIPTLRAVVAAPTTAAPSPRPPPAELVSGLSDRELQVFTLIGRGLANREIAANLNISPRTIEAHKEHLKVRLRLASNAQLTTAAARWVTRHHPDAPE